MQRNKGLSGRAILVFFVVVIVAIIVVIAINNGAMDGAGDAMKNMVRHTSPATPQPDAAHDPKLLEWRAFAETGKPFIAACEHMDARQAVGSMTEDQFTSFLTDMQTEYTNLSFKKTPAYSVAFLSIGGQALDSYRTAIQNWDSMNQANDPVDVLHYKNLRDAAILNGHQLLEQAIHDYHIENGDIQPSESETKALEDEIRANGDGALLDAAEIKK